jgi:hypothetical protein
MRNIRLILGIGAGVITLSLVAAWWLVDPNRYRGLIQSQLEQRLNRKVELGQMNLGLLPLRLQVTDPLIAEDPGFGDGMPFIRAQKLDVRVNLFSLLRGNVTVNALELQRPRVELVKNKQGRWNFSTLGRLPAEAAATLPDTPASPALTLDRLTIRDGQVAITDLQQSQKPLALYDHIDVTALNYTPSQPFSFDVAAHIAGAGAQEIRLKGEAGPISPANPAATPFAGNLRLREVGLDSLKKFLNSDGMPNAAGSLSGESQITNKSGNVTAIGTLKLDQARFNSLDLGYPIVLDYNVAANPADGAVTISSAKIQLGNTPLTLTGSIDANRTPYTLNLSCKSGDVSIAEIARLASAFGVAFAPGTTISGRVRGDVQAKGAANNPGLSGTIAADNLRISGKDVPQPVEVKTLKLTLSPSEIRSDEFQATSGSTTAQARFAVRQYTSKSPAIDLVLRAPAATLPELQSFAKAYGMTGLEQINGAGTLSLDLHAAGPLQSLTSTEVMRALNGNLTLDFNTLRIAGFDAARELAEIGGFLTPNPANQNFTDILRLSGQMIVKDGVARTDDLQAQLGIGTAAVSGTADLASESLNLKLLATFPKGVSDKAGGTRVAGYMKTVLSNSAGELLLPVQVTGNFKRPRFAPDVATFAQMQKKRLLPLDNPGAAVSNVLGALKKENKNEDQPSGDKPGQAIKGILGGLFGGKKTSSEKK